MKMKCNVLECLGQTPDLNPIVEGQEAGSLFKEAAQQFLV